MVSWSILDWLEMRGSELLVKYDIGLEFGELPDWTVHPERAISTPDGLDERLGIVNPRSFPVRSAKTGRLCGVLACDLTVYYRSTRHM
jgi:hypothetical protein